MGQVLGSPAGYTVDGGGRVEPGGQSDYSVVRVMCMHAIPRISLGGRWVCHTVGRMPLPPSAGPRACVVRVAGWAQACGCLRSVFWDGDAARWAPGVLCT